MRVTWTLLRATDPTPECPWLPSGARHAQAGHAAGSRATLPPGDGLSWTVLGVFDDESAAETPAGTPGLAEWWHVVLEPASYHGDALLAGGATPFTEVPRRGKVAGAAAVITMAGLGDDVARTTEFFERVDTLGALVADAPGLRAGLVHAPSDGAVLTFSAWTTLRDAVTWAYHRPDHAATVRRQQEHPLLARTGFLRCAVLSSSGSVDGVDPLAGLTGAPVPSTRPE
ncbi:hypothetical protein [Nocardioides sp.]|uniref:hypothetical protein n=1 Tax=Nocardioides sp. TaxID=35761 RepID=UPI0035138DD0